MLKEKKGFTLVELMIVIAIISLLMLVLIPGLGLIKNKTREAGIRSNIAVLTGIIHSNIDDYAGSAAGAALLEAKIAADITAVTIANQQMKNPVTKGTTAGAVAVLTSAMVTSYVVTTDDTDNGADIAITWGATIANSAGVIAYAAYYNTGTSKLNVHIIPYGLDNKRMTALETVISQ